MRVVVHVLRKSAVAERFEHPLIMFIVNAKIRIPSIQRIDGGLLSRDTKYTWCSEACSWSGHFDSKMFLLGRRTMLQEIANRS